MMIQKTDETIRVVSILFPQTELFIIINNDIIQAAMDFKHFYLLL